MSTPIIDVVREVFVEVRGVDPSEVVPDANLIDDLGADSLDAIEIILALENHYDKEFNEDGIEDLKTVGDVVALVQTLIE